METKSELLSGTDKPLTPAPIQDVNDNAVVPYGIRDMPGAIPARGLREEGMGDTAGSAVAGSLFTPPVKPAFRLTAGSDAGVLHDTFLPSTDPDYEFYGPISEEMLHRYLDRSITMQNMSNWHPDCDKEKDTPPDDCITVEERKQDFGMLAKLRPKFIKRLAVMWDHFNMLNNTFSILTSDVNYIHNNIDSQIIVEGAILENLFEGLRDNEYPFIKTGASPAIVRYRTMLDHYYPEYSINYESTHLKDPTTDTYKFDPERMKYSPGQKDKWGRTDKIAATVKQNENTPDITKPDTQLWFFYLAMRFIDAGCEAIHFGMTSAMNMSEDFSNGTYWRLIKNVREYARTYALRRIVLCSGCETYYRPGASILSMRENPKWDWVLMNDFYSLGVYYNEASWPSCTTGSMPLVLLPFSGLLNLGPKGMHPQGWVCSHAPLLLEYDHGDIDIEAGCGGHFEPGVTYGMDNSSWFAHQRTDLRNAILKYTYYRIKALDPYAHFDMMGRRTWFYNDLKRTKQHALYRANNNTATIHNGFAQEDTINELWNGPNTTPFGWVFHDFVFENVAHGSKTAWASLIFVGTDKIYYIGPDNNIHGFIKVNGNYNDGVWLSVSPTYAAQVRESEQVKAKSNLVASPDGKRLLYIGVDGFIHGFDIVNAWEYKYIYSDEGGFVFYGPEPGVRRKLYDGFMTYEMQRQGLRAIDLIYPMSDRIYYIADQVFDSKKRIHGFQKLTGAWQTVSPSYSAQDFYSLNVAGQFEAAGALTYDLYNHRIYYRTTFGHIAYFKVNDLVRYYYIPCPGNFRLNDAHLKVLGNFAFADGGNRIYFICQNRDTKENKIYFLDVNSGSWDLYGLYDSTARAFTPYLSDVSGQIAVSPDGSNIAYVAVFSIGPRVMIYKKDVRGQFHPAPQGGVDIVSPNSLYFNGDNDLYYAAVEPGRSGNMPIHHFKFQLNYANNPAEYAYPAP